MNNPSQAAAWSAVMMNNYGVPSIELVSGQGAVVRDVEGNEYLDLLAGIAVNVLGHADREIVESVTEQLATLGHVSNLFASQPAQRVAHKLVDRVGRSDARVFFCNSGTEANEAAFKLARLTGKTRVLAAKHGFHGRTMGALAMTGQPDKQEPFAPMVESVEFYEYGNLSSLQALVEKNPDDVAAIILEPIQGETGVIPAPAGFLSAVRELCTQIGALFIVDEVQTGVGRTGTFFAYEVDGVTPDVITMAKGLGGGLPIGAVIATGQAASLFTPGAHGTTFGGNPVVCAAANVVLDRIDSDFLDDVNRKGTALSEALLALDLVEEVRGRGLMIGVVLKQPIAKEVVAAGLRHGLILNAPSVRVLRLTPPLVISEDQIKTAVERLHTALLDAVDKKRTM